MPRLTLPKSLAPIALALFAALTTFSGCNTSPAAPNAAASATPSPVPTAGHSSVPLHH